MINPCPTIFHYPEISSFAWPIITLAALVDSINPCAIAVLLILLETLILTQGKKSAVKVGLFFILGLYLTYLAFGLGFFQALAFQKLAPYLHKIIGALALIIGLLNIKDFFFYGKGMLMEIPRSWRPKLGAVIRGATSPIGALIVGVIVTFFELPCTGGPYVFAVGYLASFKTCWQAIPILLYYNLIFVLPLLLLTGFIYFGWASVEKTEKWRTKNIKILHLLAGIIMLGLGLWLLLV